MRVGSALGSLLSAQHRPREVADALQKACGGDTITIADGTYSDLRLVWTENATAENPVVVRAETLGGVKIIGASNLRIAGNGLTVEGLCFTDGYSPEGAVIEFRNGNSLAFGCRVTECAIIDYNPQKRQTAYDDVVMHGQGNRFDHNTLSGKLNLGLMLGVNLNNEQSGENHHSIDHNLFCNRAVYGSNGAETIRVGTSQQAYTSSLTVIEENVFDHCNGEAKWFRLNRATTSYAATFSTSAKACWHFATATATEPKRISL